MLVQLFGGAFTLVFDVVSHTVSAVLLRSLPRPAMARPEAQSQSMRAQIEEGWRFVTRHPVIRPCVAAATLANFTCGAFMALLPVFLVRSLHAPAGLLGVVIATEGPGSLLGATLTPRLGGRAGSARSRSGTCASAPPPSCSASSPAPTGRRSPRPGCCPG